VKMERIVAVGGGTKGGLWTQIVSDVTGLRQELSKESMGACYGDALFAARAAGLVDDDAVWASAAASVEPNPRNRRSTTGSTRSTATSTPPRRRTSMSWPRCRPRRGWSRSRREGATGVAPLPDADGQDRPLPRRVDHADRQRGEREQTSDEHRRHGLAHPQRGSVRTRVQLRSRSVDPMTDVMPSRPWTRERGWTSFSGCRQVSL
jgi:FGGY family of carbohydrate kinases, C-terminal domain